MVRERSADGLLPPLRLHLKYRHDAFPKSVSRHEANNGSDLELPRLHKLVDLAMNGAWIRNMFTTRMPTIHGTGLIRKFSRDGMLSVAQDQTVRRIIAPKPGVICVTYASPVLEFSAAARSVLQAGHSDDLHHNPRGSSEVWRLIHIDIVPHLLLGISFDNLAEDVSILKRCHSGAGGERDRVAAR
jgi:hypothetical protein